MSGPASVIVDATGANIAEVKAASTPAAAADKALVVAVSPNNAVAVIPAGNNAVVKGFASGEVVLAATAVTAVRATAYTEQSSNAVRSLASSSASDTAAGTGARKARITYYTATFTGPFTVDVTLNGTSYVNTVPSDLCYIDDIRVIEAGSGGVNAGTLTLKAVSGGGGATIGTVAVGANQTRWAHHYVAAGRKCNITGILLGIKGADTTGGLLRAKQLDVANAAEVQISDVVRAPSSGQSWRSYNTPIVVNGPARIVAYAAPDSTSSRTYYASFDYYEEAL